MTAEAGFVKLCEYFLGKPIGLRLNCLWVKIVSVYVYDENKLGVCLLTTLMLCQYENATDPLQPGISLLINIYM